MKHRPGRLITIGSFDGVHLGHAALLTRTVVEAKRRRLKSLALTFSIPPRMILSKEHNVSILSTPFEKEYLINKVEEGKLTGLAFESEKPKMGSYKGNILITAPLAWYTKESLVRNIDLWTDTIISCLRGKPLNLVK